MVSVVSSHSTPDAPMVEAIRPQFGSSPKRAVLTKRELDKEREDKAYVIMKNSSFKVTCDLGLGEGNYTSYGCDLSYDYVKINAEYRT